MLPTGLFCVPIRNPDRSLVAYVTLDFAHHLREIGVAKPRGPEVHLYRRRTVADLERYVPRRLTPGSYGACSRTVYLDTNIGQPGDGLAAFTFKDLPEAGVSIRFPGEQEVKPMQLLRISEVAKRLGVCVETVKSWGESGDLPVIRMGRRYYVQEQDLERALQRAAGPKRAA